MKCPLCGSSDILKAETEYVCTSCGYVFTEAPEEIFVVKREEMLGSAPVHEYAFLEKIARRKSTDFYRRYGARVQHTCEVLRLPEIVREEALSLERKLLKRKFRTVSLEVFTVSVVLVASRIHGFALSYDTLSRTFKVPKNEIYRHVKRITLELGIKVPQRTAKDYILSYAPKLGVPEKVVREALQISEEVPQGVNPIVGAGASLYIASHSNGYKLRQFEIAEVLGITDVGLRVVIKRMNKTKPVLVANEIVR